MPGGSLPLLNCAKKDTPILAFRLSACTSSSESSSDSARAKYRRPGNAGVEAFGSGSSDGSEEEDSSSEALPPKLANFLRTAPCSQRLVHSANVLGQLATGCTCQVLI